MTACVGVISVIWKPEHTRESVLRLIAVETWAAEDILLTGSSDDVDAAAMAIQSEYVLRRENGKLFVTVPAFTAEQKIVFDSLVEKHLSPLIDEYNELTTSFIAGYKRLFPRHLQEDADRMCRNIYFGLGYVLLSCAQKTGIIEPPPGVTAM